MKLPSLGEVKKLTTYVVGAVVTATAYGFLHGAVATYAAAFVAFATAVGIYKVPNNPPAPPSATPEPPKAV